MGLDKDRIVEKDAIIEELICTICTDIVENPMQGQCQHSFCEQCIRKWLSGGKSSCPVDRQRLELKELKPTRLLNQLLSKFTIRCKYYQNGCKLLAKYDDILELVDHEANQCSNQSGSIHRENKKLKKDIETLEKKLLAKDKELVEQHRLLSAILDSSPSLASSDGINISRVYSRDPTLSLVSFRNNTDPPTNAILHGNQTDKQKQLWSVIANTSHGQVPGKANKQVCWYSYGGKEYDTKDFSWIISDGNSQLLKYNERLKLDNGNFDPPYKAIKIAVSHDGNGPYYSIIARTQWGLVPGKANQRQAWFPYGGKEHTTFNFDWIVIDAT